ncbi:alpha/beta fold hydrolase [Catellatospora sichuanensis]|uniref:alpha/beta fold hydrolase n=1 Tax=Catellatospora sichuanensis TaxID=1969805 RepID=UPI00118338B2|nr:alpha/beta hydrolase [Catellatospora sichuanensis]
MQVVRDGVRLECHDSGGDGPAIVLLHGLAGHAGEFADLQRALPAGLRCVAVDQRAHVPGEPVPADLSRAAYARDVAFVIEQLGPGKAVLVGQSLGGHTAMLAAAARPDLVRGLVMIEAGPEADGPELPAEIGGWLDSWPVPFSSRAQAAEFFGGGPVGAGWAAGLVERDGGLWPRFARDAMVDSIATLVGAPAWTEWDSLTVPVLVVRGERGIMTDAEVARMTERPDTGLVTVLDAGHDVHLDQPVATAAAISAYLDSRVPAA